MGPSDKPLFFHKASSVKSTPHSPQLFHQEDSIEKYQFSNFGSSITDICVFHFSILVSVDPQKCS